jgi:formylglycine-generating enzyme required for sulfatase activity
MGHFVNLRSFMSVHHSTDLPFIHELTPARLRALQTQAAQEAGLDVNFHDTLRNGDSGPELTIIPAGRFEMGAPASQIHFGDLPQHSAQIAAHFAIGRYCITASEFDVFASDTGFIWQSHLMRSEGRQPVINVSTEEAHAYLAWLSTQTGQRYRLPSEAEWEYAARAGSLTAYCFGDRLTCGEANIHSLHPPATPAKGWRRFIPVCVPLNRTAEVGSYPPNVWGLFEVHGNVWELTDSPWIGSLDSENTAGLNRKGHWIVTKGGSWFEGTAEARSASRKPRLREELDTNLSLRVLREI